MLIAVNAGNSRVLLGGYEEDGQVFSASIATEPKLTRDDYACKLQQVLLLYGVNVRRIHGESLSARSFRAWSACSRVRCACSASAMSSRYRAASRPDSTSAPSSRGRSARTA